MRRKIITRSSWSLFGKTLLFLISFSFICASAANAALFLNFTFDQDIKGESTDEGHKDWIVLNSFDWGATNSAGQSSSGSGAGKVIFSDLTITKPVDTASPKLLAAVSTGRHFKEVDLDVTKAMGDKQQTYLEFKFQEVLVSGYRISDTADSIPTETLTLNFSKIEEIFTKFNETGGAVQITGTAVATTPIPASLLLLSSGLIAIIGFRRR